MNKIEISGYSNTDIRKENIMETIQKIALVFTIIGALNWGFIGLFDLDLVAMLFGSMSMLSRVIYTIVGIAGLINIGIFLYHFDTKK